jgi:hypothetical protein
MGRFYAPLVSESTTNDRLSRRVTVIVKSSGAIGVIKHTKFSDSPSRPNVWASSAQRSRRPPEHGPCDARDDDREDQQCCCTTVSARSGDQRGRSSAAGGGQWRGNGQLGRGGFVQGISIGAPIPFAKNVLGH